MTPTTILAFLVGLIIGFVLVFAIVAWIESPDDDIEHHGPHRG